ncbi:hypothetical protein GUITHDRAFT_155310, partial [Guillardia theta CCMP2712]
REELGAWKRRLRFRRMQGAASMEDAGSLMEDAGSLMEEIGIQERAGSLEEESAVVQLGGGAGRCLKRGFPEDEG